VPYWGEKNWEVQELWRVFIMIMTFLGISGKVRVMRLLTGRGVRLGIRQGSTKSRVTSAPLAAVEAYLQKRLSEKKNSGESEE